MKQLTLLLIISFSVNMTFANFVHAEEAVQPEVTQANSFNGEGNTPGEAEVIQLEATQPGEEELINIPES